MTYKQTIYFICKCLSLSKYPERKKEISDVINSGNVDWESVVRVGSNQVVIPALYYNLKEAQLLNLLPEGLELYFEEISNSNRRRNKELIKQANHIVSVLDQHNIQYVFLKGMAHTLEELYLNIGERMISDIDILVSKHQLKTVTQLLTNEGYFKLYKDGDFVSSRHYTRLIHDNYIGAIEVHWNVFDREHATKLSCEEIVSDKQKTGGYYVPSYSHQAIHNVFNVQLNDTNYKTGLVLIRHLYDCFLLTSNPETQNSLKEYKYDSYLKNVYLKLMQQLFKVDSALYKKSFFLNILMLRYEISINKTLYTIHTKSNYYIFRFFNYFKQFFLSFSNQTKRKGLIKNLKTKGWLKRHIKSFK